MRKNRGHNPASSGGEQGFWPSYADMMSAVALILFFLMLLSYIQNMITGNNLRGVEDELTQTMNQLAIAAAEVADKEQELEGVTLDLDTAQKALLEQQIQLAQQEAQLAEQQAFIDSQKASIAEQQILIDQQKAQADRQQQYLNDTQAELADMRSQMQSIAVLRLSIVEQIRSSIEKVMGNTNTVSVSDTGNLVLGESILFDRGSSTLKWESKEVLDQLADSFVAFLTNEDNLPYVDTIVIGGHADITGDAATNRTLSSDRANSVLNYLMSTRGGELQPYAEFFCASGYGSNRPVADNSTAEGQAQNRRIEISVVLKDESVLKIVDDYLAIEMPKG